MDSHRSEEEVLPSSLSRPVPPGFVTALSMELSRITPDGVAHSVVIWEGRERVGINFREVSDQDAVIDAVSKALDAIDSQFEYFPGIDISIWKP